MAKNESNLEKVTIRLTKDSSKKLDEFYPKLGYNKVIRTLVDKHIRLLEEKLSHNLGDLNDRTESESEPDLPN